MRPTVLGCLFLAGCVSVPEPPDRKEIQNPERAVAFFAACVKARQYDFAHQALSADTKRQLSQEALTVAFESYPTLRRIVAACESHRVTVNGDRARARVCNPLMGVSYEIGLKKEFGKIWALDLTPKEIDELTAIGREWIALQWEEGLGRTLAAPDSRPIPVHLRCGCDSKGKGE
jgi:hypothetical protein